MPDIRLDGSNFTVALDANGSPRVTVSTRPSQYGDPGDLTFAEWRVDGHDFNSVEMIPPGGSQGYLGRDYGVNTDGRWPGMDCLGPLINTISLDDYDSPAGVGFLGSNLLGTTFLLGPSQIVQNSNGMAIIKADGVPWGYIIRGTKAGRVRLDTMAVANTTMALSNPATDIIATTPASTTVLSEVSVGQGDGAAYHVLQQPDVTSTSDTWAANSSSQAARIFGSAPDRTVLVASNVVKGNVQTGSVTMKAPNWSTVTTITTQDVKGTGFAMDGNLWVIVTSDGPYMLDSQTGDFFPLIPELDNDALNGLQTNTWYPLGVIIPLRFSLRYQRYGSGESFGPETFADNRSPVQGTPTGVAGSPRELFTTQYNPTTGDTYLISWYTARSIDDAFSVQHSNVLSPFVIAKFTAKESKFLKWVGTVDSARTSPTLMGGYGSDAFYMTCGRTSRWIDDSAYLTATSGQTFLTKTRRQPGIIKDIEWAEFETDDCAAARTVRLAVSLDDGSYTDMGDAAITSDGVQRVVGSSSAGVPTAALHGGIDIKPRLTYSSSVSTTTPKVQGTLRIYYRVRPRVIRSMTYTLDLVGGKAGTPDEQEATLRGMVYDGPELLEDIDRRSIYVRVRSVSESRMEARGGGDDSSRGLVRVVDVTVETWQTS